MRSIGRLGQHARRSISSSTDFVVSTISAARSSRCDPGRSSSRPTSSSEPALVRLGIAAGCATPRTTSIEQVIERRDYTKMGQKNNHLISCLSSRY